MGWSDFFSLKRVKKRLYISYENGEATSACGLKVKLKRTGLSGYSIAEIDGWNLRTLLFGWEKSVITSVKRDGDKLITRDGIQYSARKALPSTACWDKSGRAREAATCIELLARGIISDSDYLIPTEDGMAHLVVAKTAGCVLARDVSPFTLVGDGYGRMDAAAAVIMDPLLDGRLLEAAVDHFKPFTDAAVITAISAVDWASMSLPPALLHALQAIVSTGHTVGSILAGAASPYGVPLLEPAVRLYSYYKSRRPGPHDSARVYSGSETFFAFPPTPPETAVRYMARRAFNLFESSDCRMAIDPAVFAAKNSLKGFPDSTAAERAIMNVATTQALEIASCGQKPYLDLPSDVSEVTAGLIQRRFPEFHVRMVSRRHVHGVAQVVRHAFLNIVHDRLVKSKDPRDVHFVGGMPGQVARFSNVIHNCAPFMTGRDDFRVNEMCSKADRAHFGLISENHRLQDCTHSFAGAVMVAPFSTGDITATDFIRQMIHSGCRSAYVAVNLPVVFLDSRVTTYRDEWNGFEYQRRDGKVYCYHTGGASAGYVNSAETLMSWCSPLPIFKGFHVQVEEIRRFGTSFLLHVGVGIGKQEVTPTMWRVTDEKFYLLPLLIPRWREPEERYFVVPKKRFEAIVEFAMAPGTQKDLAEVLATKIRGQQAEIKIGGHVVEPRWELDLDEFNAVAGHAMVAAEMRAHDRGITLLRLRAYLARSYAAHGRWGLFGRALMYAYRLFTLQLHGERSPFGLSFFDRVFSYLYATSLDRNQLAAFYTAVGEYRVVSGEDKIQGPALLDDILAIKDFVIACGYKTASTWEFFNESMCHWFHFGEVETPDYPKKTLNVSEASTDDDTEFSAASAAGSVADEGPVTQDAPGEPIAYPPSPSVSDTTDEDDLLRPDQIRPTHDDDVEVVTGPLFENTGRVSDGLMYIYDLDTELRTKSRFDPFGALVPSQDGSRSDGLFFRNYTQTTDFTTVKEWIPCPDSGVAHIIDYAGRLRSDKPYTIFDDNLLRQTLMNRGDETETILGRHVGEFFANVCRDDILKPVQPVLALDGVAGSAKSSVIRQYLKRNNIYGALVVTPSGKLKKEWSDAGDWYTACTQHGWRDAFGKPPVIVLDEVFCLDFKVFLGWLTLAGRLGSTVWCLGERNQRYVGSGAVPSHWIDESDALKIMLPVSNTMPLDAATCAKKLIKDTGPFEFLQTRSNIDTSIFFCDPVIAKGKIRAPKDGESIFVTRSSDPHLDIGIGLTGAPSISQVQGARFDTAVFAAGEKSGAINWLSANPNQAYIALSRHRNSLLVVMTTDNARVVTRSDLEQYAVVRGNYGKKNSAEPPFMLDCLDTDVHFANGNVFTDLNSDVSIVSRLERVNSLPSDWTPEIALDQTVEIREIADVISRVAQHDAIFDHSHALDMTFGKAGTLDRIGEFEIKVGSVSRSPLPDVDKIAVHQRADNTFDDLRNVALRQTDVVQRVIGEGQLCNEVHAAYKLLKESFFKEEYVTYSPYRDPEAWLKTRTSAYLAEISNGMAVYCEDGSTLRHRGFLKTQDKVKPDPGFSASWTHGQTVIASDHSYNAWAGPIFKNLTARVQDGLRDDVVIDVGYSDRDLARLLREKGMLASFAEENTQIDISRQDSSHSAVSLGVFVLLMIDCGISEDDAVHYLHRRSQYSFRSLHPGTYAGRLRFNLPSGDPLTLICNVIQEMTTCAERFVVSGCPSVHKGDDSIYGLPVLKNRAGAPIMSLRDVNLKIGYGLPAYHAGRFFTHDDILIDPVRRFLKHFARSYNPHVSNDELFLAVKDWHFRATEFNMRYLRAAAARFYPDFSEEDVDVMLRCIACLSDRSFFDKTYPLAGKIRGPIVEFEMDCALNLFEHVVGPARAEVRDRLLNGTRRQIATIFRNRTHLKVFEHRSRIDRRRAMPGVHIEPEHIYLVLDPISGKRKQNGRNTNVK